MKGALRVVGSLAVLPLICLGQQRETKLAAPEIRGLVIEVGTKAPVADAEISLLEAAESENVVTFESLKNVSQTARTGPNGAFAFRLPKLGSYRVHVKKENYSKAPGFDATIQVTLDERQPVREVTFMLARVGELSGTLMDEITREPIPGLMVNVGRRRYVRGEASLVPVASAIPDKQGRFSVRGIEPGEYVVQTGTRAYTAGSNPDLAQFGRPRLLTQFAEKDLKAVDSDYQQAWWPGGGDLASALPLLLSSNASADMGELFVRKTSTYRIHVSVPDADCAPGEMLSVGFGGPGSPPRGLRTAGRVPCGADFLLTGFAPGSYRLEVYTEGTRRDVRRTGSIPFDIADQNLELIVPLVRGLDVEGRVLAVDGAARPDFKALRLVLAPIERPPFFDETTNPVDAEGRFRIVNAPARELRLLVSGLGSHYVKQVRYNGSQVRDNVIVLDGRAQGQLLDITLDDKPARVWGEVIRGDEPVSRPYVVLLPWPVGQLGLVLAMRSAMGDDNGKFVFEGLPPGEYRVFAISSAERERINEPGVADRLLSRAAKVTLEERGFQNLRLDPSSRSKPTAFQAVLL